MKRFARTNRSTVEMGCSKDERPGGIGKPARANSRGRCLKNARICAAIARSARGGTAAGWRARNSLKYSSKGASEYVRCHTRREYDTVDRNEAKPKRQYFEGHGCRAESATSMNLTTCSASAFDPV